MKMSSKKITAIIASMVLACGLSVGGTIAWLFDDASVTNTFEMANVEGSIPETFENNVKSNVKVTNNGDIPAYVRVMLTPTIMNDDGTSSTPDSIANVKPVEGENYTLDLNTTQWFKGSDGFYYYKTPVEAGDETAVLVNSAMEQNLEEGQYLRLDVSAQLIQADPTTAVEEAWGVTVDGEGNISE